MKFGAASTDTLLMDATSNLRFLRTFCWLTAGLYPSWSLFLYVALPEAYDDIAGRCVVGACFAVLALAVGHSKWLEQRFETVVYGGFCLVAAHFWFLVYRSNLSTVYLVGALIVAVCYNLCFAKVRPIIVYSLVVVTLSLLVAWLTDAPMQSKLMLNAGIITVQITSLSSVSIRSRVLQTLEAEKLTTLTLRQALVDKELEAAEAVQRTLLTRSVDLPEITMATFYKAAEKTGGDWYGHYHDVRANVLYFWIGDVTGHGAASALITGVACGALYSGERRADYLGDTSSVHDRLITMATVNNAVICNTKCELLMTMFFGALALDTGAFSSINAGHPQPVLVSGGKATGRPSVPSNPLGFSERSTFHVAATQLKVGDSLFLYTDGLTENMAMTGASKQKARLTRLLETCRDSRDAVKRVETEFSAALRGEHLNDDVTFMGLTWNGKREALGRVG